MNSAKVEEQYITPPKHLKDIEILKKDYKIGKVIGTGKYGLVCNGTMGKDGHKTEIAVKIVDLKKTSEEYRLKFLPKELYHLEELKHKYIVKVYDIKASENTFYIFMEKAFGGDLLDMMKDNQFKTGMTEIKAKSIYKMIASALKYIHDRGSAHRDIKCENVLLMDKERTIAKLTDFGFSTTCFDPQTLHKMLKDTFCGTPTYSAPEIEKQEPYDAMKADVWSLGVVLFIILQNIIPFSVREVQNIVKNPKTFKLEFKRNDLSKESKDLITKQLEIDPTKRLNMAQVCDHRWLR